MSEVCRSCKAPIRWCVTAGGAVMPVDLEPAANGNLRLERKPADLPRVVVVPAGYRVDGEPLYLSHFATCEFAAEHRRRR